MKPGEKLLETLSKEHLAEISQTGPALIEALHEVLSRAGVSVGTAPA
jgi:hypothetical protein